MNFGKRMKAMRKEKGMTMLELANKLEISKSGLAAYEGNTRRPPQDKLKEIAETLDTSTDYLLGITDNPIPPKEMHNIAKYLQSKHFHYNGRKLNEKDLDLLIRILERISKENAEKNNHNKC